MNDVKDSHTLGQCAKCFNMLRPDSWLEQHGICSECLMEPDEITWTTTYPSKPGFYLCKAHGGDYDVCVIHYPGDELVYAHTMKSPPKGTWFWGPIKPCNDGTGR